MQDKKNFLENQLNFVGVIGLKNEVRKNVKRTVALAKKAETEVRVVSGDDHDVAVLAAFQAGIIKENEVEKEEICMSAVDFEDRLGSYRYVTNENGEERLIFDDHKHACAILNSVRVITRAEPKHKELLVQGL